MAAAIICSDWGDSTLTAEERQGTVISATRCFLVGGLSQTTANISEALSVSGMPADGDFYPGSNNLLVTSRQVSVLDKSSPSMAKVIVGYEQLGYEDGNFVFEGTSCISQDVTNSDSTGAAVLLSYTYGALDSNTQLAGTTETQFAQMEVLLPESTLTATGILSVSKPSALVDQWIGYINAAAWMGKPALHWMCTQVNFKIHNIASSPPRYKFTFEFQSKRKGYTQSVYFHRSDNGQIPSDVIFGTGYRRVIVQGYKDFTTLFPDV